MRVFAAPKINLTLEVLGRRADGYHELQSLVAFGADCGDVLDLEPSAHPRLEVTGPFSGRITAPNILERAVALLHAAEPRLRIGKIVLEKNLPIASGIGGGSADAAALLRALTAANPEYADKLDWMSLARGLGADVPVCMLSRASFMTGIGEKLLEVGKLPELAAVLATPVSDGPPDKTARVFASLRALPLLDTTPGADQPSLPDFATPEALIAFIAERGNHLLAPATRLFPAITQTFSEIAATDGCRIASLSGAGPTCFGLFQTLEQAEAATGELARRHPDWWLASTRLM